jgi:hypothetical protein
MATETFHLWRQFPTAPFYRWACEVVVDPEAPEGYRTLTHDPMVADTAFFHRLARAVSTEHEALRMKQSSGIVAHEVVRAKPGDADFFAHAFRNVEGAVLGQPPERYSKLNAKKPAAGGAV